MILSHGTGFEGLRASWRAAEACHHRKPGQANVEGADSVAVKNHSHGEELRLAPCDRVCVPEEGP